jgi:hypothetical protein
MPNLRPEPFIGPDVTSRWLHNTDGGTLGTPGKQKNTTALGRPADTE